MRNQILNVKSLMFLFALVLLTCGMSDISYAQVCNVGDILSPGESCIDPGSGSTFSVLADGRGQILFITSGGNITLRAVLNGVQYNFVASKQADGSWKIEAVTPGDTTPTVPSTVDNPEDMSIPYQTLSGHTAAVWQVAYSPDGSTLASGSGDKTVRLWDAHTGEHKQTLRHTNTVTSVAYSPDGNTLASGDLNQIIGFWAAATGELIAGTQALGASILSLNYSPDSSRIAVGAGRDIALIDPPNNTEDDIVLEKVLTGHTDAVWSVAYSPDGSTLASGSADGTIRLWDAHTGEHKQTISGHTDTVWSVAYSPDGSTLASGSADKTIRLWDAHTGEHKQTISGHTEVVWSVAYSPDGSTLASGSGDKTIRLWNAHTGEHKQTISGHTDSVWSVAYSPDGSTLASGSGDKTIRLYKILVQPPVQQPDLVVESVQAEPAAVESGQRFRLYATLRNNGTAESAATTLRYYRSTDAIISTEDTQLGTGRRNPLAANATIRRYLNVTAPTTPGTYYYGVCVDSVTNESDTTNNCSAAVSITVQQLTQQPDLVVDPVEAEPSTVSPGEQFRLYATLRNQGTGTSGATTLRYYRSADAIISTEDTQLGTGRRNPLAANATIRRYLNVTAPTTPGTYYYGVCVDSVTNESDTTNNCSTAVGITVTPPIVSEDVNDDGVVDVQDLVYVAQRYGQTGTNRADVNGDGIVNIDDLIVVAAVVDSAPAAPAARSRIPKDLTAGTVNQWLTEAKLTGKKTPTYQRGILTLEQLLAVLTPKETALLANYPNPFNPETWIPYHLANDSDVLLSIYDINGALVRELDLGHQRAGYYTDRSRAAYWDGRNEWGEPVASGVYFYQLRAGDYLKLRKMVIVK